MIPAYFIRLDRIPLNANGKLSRNDLPRPELTAGTVPYAKPENGIEERICKAAEAVLGREGIGTLDDLYALGLDSLSSIRLIMETELTGLSVSMLYMGLTPREIAKIYQENIREKDRRSAGSGGISQKKTMPCSEKQRRRHEGKNIRCAGNSWRFSTGSFARRIPT